MWTNRHCESRPQHSAPPRGFPADFARACSHTRPSLGLVLVARSKSAFCFVMEWIQHYLTAAATLARRQHATAHRVFYAICQSAFYVVCFHHRTLQHNADGTPFLAQFNWDAILLSPLLVVKVGYVACTHSLRLPLPHFVPRSTCWCATHHRSGAVAAFVATALCRSHLERVSARVPSPTPCRAPGSHAVCQREAAPPRCCDRGG